MMSIADNVKRVLDEIASAAALAGRNPGEITLVAAAKTNSVESVREAILAGITHVGENRVQELLEKNAARAYEGASLHFIGQLQKNKVNKIVGAADLIHSVDSLELLRLIASRGAALGVTQSVLLEVNIAGERTKAGFAPRDLGSALERAGDLTGVFVRGLMAIPPISKKSGANRGYFAAMRELFIDIIEKKYDNVSMDCLSMGMSGDFFDAILEGSTMVRIGTAIFGVRKAPEKTASGDR